MAKKKPKILFTHLVEYVNTIGKFNARFTNKKHAISYAKRYKELKIPVSVYQINPDGSLKPIRCR